MRDRGHGFLEEQIAALLPTPTGWLGRRPANADIGTSRTGVAGRSVEVTDAIALLPTPTTEPLTGTEYGPAVDRWAQVTGRPAPDPTEPGKGGERRLSARFTEWMMGLPPGWVTDVGIPRAAQHTAIGNGICPQQMVLAIRLLLPEAVTL